MNAYQKRLSGSCLKNVFRGWRDGLKALNALAEDQIQFQATTSDSSQRPAAPAVAN